jgi:hypothetical protein
MDAAGEPARLAAVLVDGDDVLFCSCGPPAELMAALCKRNDAQICALEIAAVSLALSAFHNRLHGRRIMLWIDNTAAESIIRAGAPLLCLLGQLRAR